MASSTMPVGRINFVLRTLAVTGTAFALEFLLRGDTTFPLRLLPRYLHAFGGVIVFGLVGIYLVKAINGRLLDAGLPRWYNYPAFALWLLATSIPIIWIHKWSIGLALFALLLLAGGFIPSNSVRAKITSVDKTAEDNRASAPKKKIPTQLLVNPVGFLRSLLTLACLWLPLIWLADTSGGGAGMWIARCGYVALCVAWLTRILGRLEDAGWSPQAHHGYLLIGVIVLIRMLRRFENSGGASQWYRYATSILPPWLGLINGYEMLALFLLIQVPLAFLPTKPRTAEPPFEIAHPWASSDGEILASEELRNRARQKRGRQTKPIGPFTFLCALLVFACIWIPLIYMDNASDGNVGSWIARLGYAMLGFFWFGAANQRFKDAGWAHSWYPLQYCFVASVASLMPLAAHWVDGYGALAIFVIIQTPTAFLRSKPMPEEALTRSAG